MVETKAIHRAHLARQMSQIPEMSIRSPGTTSIATTITNGPGSREYPEAILPLMNAIPAMATIDPQMLA